MGQNKNHYCYWWSPGSDPNAAIIIDIILHAKNIRCVGTPNPMRKFKDKPSFQLARSFQEKIIKHKV
jgi:hypothetical protein